MLCLICETPDDDRPDNGNEIDTLFGLILRRQSKGCVCFEGGPSLDYYSLEQEYGDNALELFSGHELGQFCSLSDFIDLLPYFLGSWTDFFLFPSASPEYSELVLLSHDRGPAILYPIGASHVFSNIDSAYWALYTENRDDVESVEGIWHRTRRYEVRVTQHQG